jgi:hypothetical protein
VPSPDEDVGLEYIEKSVKNMKKEMQLNAIEEELAKLADGTVLPFTFFVSLFVLQFESTHVTFTSCNA